MVVGCGSVAKPMIDGLDALLSDMFLDSILILQGS